MHIFSHFRQILSPCFWAGKSSCFFALFVFLWFPLLSLKKHRLYDTKAQTCRLAEVAYYLLFLDPRLHYTRYCREHKKKGWPLPSERCQRVVDRWLAGDYVETTRPRLSVPQAISNPATARFCVNQMGNEFLVCGPAIVLQWRSQSHSLNFNNPVECPCWTLAEVGLPRRNALNV